MIYPHLVFFDMWKPISAEKSSTAINSVDITSENLQNEQHHGLLKSNMLRLAL